LVQRARAQARCREEEAVRVAVEETRTHRES
jgi:hypothetical protein